MPSELKPILKQRQVGEISDGPRGFDLCDDGCEFTSIQGVGYGGPKTFHTTYYCHSRNPGGPGDPFQVRARARRGWETADREQAFVVEKNVEQLLGAITRHGAKTAKVHQKRAVAIHDDHFLFGQAQS